MVFEAFPCEKQGKRGDSGNVTKDIRGPRNWNILLLPIDSKEEELEKRNEGREKEEGYIN